MDRKNLSPGAKLRQLRKSLGLTLRDVEERALEIAQGKNNPYYALSHGWLADIEKGVHVPSIHKLYTLSVLYGHSWVYLNSLFDLRINDLAQDQAVFGVSKTRLLAKPEDPPQNIVLPLRFRREQTLAETTLLAKFSVVWGDIPVALVRLLSPDEALYGFVGVEDQTLSPLIRPGSFVQIDVKQTKIQEGPWATQEDRPIYFVELRGSYACSWCEIHGGELWLVPHPKSGREIRRFEHPREAEIIGQVTGVAMRIAGTRNKPMRTGSKKNGWSKMRAPKKERPSRGDGLS